MTEDIVIDACEYWLKELSDFTSCEETRQLIERRIKKLHEMKEELVIKRLA